MQQHLVIWGDIGTDRKALIAIEFNADSHKVIYRAFPEEVVDQELQHNLFTIWKNGGAFEFAADIPIWEMDANLDNILPAEIVLHKPGMLVSAKKQWNKSLLLHDNFKLFSEKLHLIELELESANTFDQKLWTRTKALWDDILKRKKEQELAWTQADELKLRVNSLFDGLKALRRLNHEKSFEESHVLTKAFSKQIDDCKAQLVYPDEWNKIFNRLKEIQKDMKDAPLLHKHRRQIFNDINKVFDELRSYKKANHVQHIDGRIDGLKRVLRGLVQSIDRDEESYKNQFEKMKHYTRGKMSDEEIENQLKYMKDRRKAKDKKIKSIEKTIRSLEGKKDQIANAPEPVKKKRPARKKKKADKGPAPESSASKTKAADQKIESAVQKVEKTTVNHGNKTKNPKAAGKAKAEKSDKTIAEPVQAEAKPKVAVDDASAVQAKEEKVEQQQHETVAEVAKVDKTKDKAEVKEIVVKPEDGRVEEQADKADADKLAKPKAESSETESKSSETPDEGIG